MHTNHSATGIVSDMDAHLNTIGEYIEFDGEELSPERGADAALELRCIVNLANTLLARIGEKI